MNKWLCIKCISYIFDDITIPIPKPGPHKTMPPLWNTFGYTVNDFSLYEKEGTEKNMKMSSSQKFQKNTANLWTKTKDMSPRRWPRCAVHHWYPYGVVGCCRHICSSERSACTALRRCRQNVVETLNCEGFFSSSSLLSSGTLPEGVVLGFNMGS